jgi:ATP-dependent helicase/DNAse subunit B
VNTERTVSIHRRKTLPVLPPNDMVPAVNPTPAHPLIVSVSELSAFLRCRSRWYWSYLAGLRRKTDSREYRSIGIIVHDTLEQWHGLQPKIRYGKQGRRLIGVFVNVELKKATGFVLDEKMRVMVRAMVIGYAAWARMEDREIGLRECAPEEWFDLPLTKDGSIIVRGKIDNRFEPVTLKRTMAMQEFKTKSKIDFSMIDLNFQLSTYLWALRQKFPKHRRYIAYHTILRRQMPGPRVTAALFSRTMVERTDQEIDRWVRDVQSIAADMVAPRIYPNVQPSCQWDCDFYNPCLLRSEPRDLKFVLKSEYTTERETR